MHFKGPTFCPLQHQLEHPGSIKGGLFDVQKCTVHPHHIRMWPQAGQHACLRCDGFDAEVFVPFVVLDGKEASAGEVLGHPHCIESTSPEVLFDDGIVSVNEVIAINAHCEIVLVERVTC